LAARRKLFGPGLSDPRELKANETFRSAESQRAARSAERHGKIGFQGFQCFFADALDLEVIAQKTYLYFAPGSHYIY
jgi:hypothetical protein